MSAHAGSSSTPQLIVATRNPAKVAAIRRIADPLAVVSPLPDHVRVPEEAGGDVGEVAAGKARAASVALPGELVVASDGGLLIPALADTWDPLRTRRFAGPETTDSRRADRLLALTDGLSGDERRIGWQEALAVARDGELLAAWQAEDAPGLLARDYDSALVEAGGFWIPALWICPEFGARRLAGLTATERAARHDHWMRLGLELRRFLESLPSPQSDQSDSGRAMNPAPRRSS